MLNRLLGNAGTPSLSSLLEDLPRGDSSRKATAASTSQVAFAPPQAVAQGLPYRPGDLFLGVLGARTEVDPSSGSSYVQGGTPVGISDDRHMMTVAGTRAGKGRSAIIPNLLTWPHSVLAIDPKGELASLTASARRDMLGQDVHVLDPFGVANLPPGTRSSALNPLRCLSRETLVEGAALIADALVVVQGNNPHWDESAKNFIEGLIAHVVTYPYYEGRANLGTVRRLLALAGQGGALEEEMRNNPCDEDGQVELAASDFFDRPPEERGSVLSTTRRHLKFLDFPPIREVLEGHDFDLGDLKTKPKGTTIYLCLPARHMGTCNRWLRLFINLALQEMERLAQRPATGGPVLLCLDEFATLGHMRQIEDAAGQMAGFGIKLWPILQDLTQLKALYGERWETFLGNAGVLQFFGNNDLTTLEWISKRCGTTTVPVRQDAPTAARNAAQSGMSGKSWSNQMHALLTPEEVGRYFGRDDERLRQLILRPGKDPIILQRAYWDKHDLFARYR